MAYKLRKGDENVTICEGAAVVGDVTLGKGVSIWYNAVLRGDEGSITVGDDTNIQEFALLLRSEAQNFPGEKIDRNRKDNTDDQNLDCKFAVEDDPHS